MVWGGICVQQWTYLIVIDDRTQIYRRAGERTALCCVQETVPVGGGSVMVWGGI